MVGWIKGMVGWIKGMVGWIKGMDGSIAWMDEGKVYVYTDMWIVSTVYFQQIVPQTRELSVTVVNFTLNYFQKYDKLSGNKC